MSKNTNLSFLTDYITADITNGRIGINNASPAYAFDVTGIARTSTSTYLATASGNVGIGTSSPTRLLDVSAAGTAYIRTSDTTNSVNVDMLSASSGGWIGTQSNHSFQLQTNNTERMRITAAGNVGIGTSSPAYPLQVAGTAVASNFFSVIGTQLIQVNTWTTFYTLAADQGMYTISIGLGENVFATWYAYGTVFSAFSICIFQSLTNGTLVQMRLSGMDVQVLLGSGASFARTLNYKILRS